MIQPETEDALRSFVSGSLTPREFEAWLVSAIDELSDREQQALWRMRLLLVEHGEGLRPLEDVRRQAATILTELASSRNRPPRLGRAG